MAESLTIAEILSQVLKGQIRIPSFQRGFVWDADRVTYLMDSIYKGYPIGSLLLWQTKERLKVERDLGPFTIPEAPEDYPVFYVLDGQQRITSIFGVFQNEIEPNSQSDWLDIYFDLQADNSPQESQFIALAPSEIDCTRHFPLRALFDVPTYGKLLKGFEEDNENKIYNMWQKFQTARIPAEVTKTEDRATVAIIFERVNRQGIDLNTFQLLTAWTWSEEFQLQSQFDELASEISSFGFKDIGDDTNLLLRCCSAILASDASPNALMSLNGEQVRDNFDKITNGIKYSIDYLKSHFRIATIANLPYSTLIVPLSVFFAVSGSTQKSYTTEQAKIINKWFWRSSFSRRYSSGVIRNLNADIAEMAKLRDNQPSSLGEFNVTVSHYFFYSSDFAMTSVNTKTFILMLSQLGPRSFISGAPLDLEDKLKSANRTEFHHLMPRKFVKESGQDEAIVSKLANFCFLSREDNRKIGGVAPSKYVKLIEGDQSEIFSSAMIPSSLLGDDLEKFLDERSELLAKYACELCDVEFMKSSWQIVRALSASSIKSIYLPKLALR